MRRRTLLLATLVADTAPAELRGTDLVRRRRPG